MLLAREQPFRPENTSRIVDMVEYSYGSETEKTFLHFEEDGSYLSPRALCWLHPLPLTYLCFFDNLSHYAPFAVCSSLHKGIATWYEA